MKFIYSIIFIMILTTGILGQTIKCQVGEMSEDGTRVVTCPIRNSDCKISDKRIECQTIIFDVYVWPKVWDHKRSPGSLVQAIWKNNELTPVSDTCEERIRTRALQLAHISARHDIDLLTPPDCHHLSSEARHKAAKGQN